MLASTTALPSADLEAVDGAALIVQILDGYLATKALTVSLEIGIFEALADGPASLAAVCARLGTHERPTDMLLTACCAIGLVERTDGLYRLAPLAARYLVRSSPLFMGGHIERVDRQLYPAFTHLAEAARNNRRIPSRRQGNLFDDLYSSEEEVRRFVQAMHPGSLRAGRTLAALLDLAQVELLLDVGGGSGGACIAACQAAPTLRACVFDLPPVVPVAREYIAAAGLEARIATCSGDFFRDPLPPGADLALLARVVHDWGPDENRAILQAVYDALRPGGTVAIYEALLDDDRTGPLLPALFSLIMLLETDAGRQYSGAELRALLEATGFVEVRVQQLGGEGDLVLARKPGPALNGRYDRPPA